MAQCHSMSECTVVIKMFTLCIITVKIRIHENDEFLSKSSSWIHYCPISILNNLLNLYSFFITSSSGTKFYVMPLPLGTTALMYKIWFFFSPSEKVFDSDIVEIIKLNLFVHMQYDRKIDTNSYKLILNFQILIRAQKFFFVYENTSIFPMQSYIQ